MLDTLRPVVLTNTGRTDDRTLDIDQKFPVVVDNTIVNNAPLMFGKELDLIASTRNSYYRGGLDLDRKVALFPAGCISHILFRNNITDKRDEPILAHCRIPFVQYGDSLMVDVGLEPKLVTGPHNVISLPPLIIRGCFNNSTGIGQIDYEWAAINTSMRLPALNGVDAIEPIGCVLDMRLVNVDNSPTDATFIYFK